MISIAAIDDSKNILDDYINNIPKWLSQNNIDGELVIATSSPNKFINAVENNLVNVCIIDINLKNDTNGMDLARQVRAINKSCEIIFVTACLEYIQEAFEVKAYGFIQKPRWDKLQNTLVDLSKEKQLNKRSCIDIKCGSQVFFIQIEDINYIEHLQTKTVIHTSDGDYHTYEGLEELVDRINDVRFKRCHRSIFINTFCVYCLDVKNKEFILKDKSRCSIGPKYFANFKTQEGWRQLLCL